MVFALKGARIKSILEFFWLEMDVEWTKQKYTELCPEGDPFMFGH